jgi:hypothetical protein
MENPGKLVELAKRLGYDIGRPTEAPTTLLGRFLSLADGFREGP